MAQWCDEFGGLTWVEMECSKWIELDGLDDNNYDGFIQILESIGFDLNDLDASIGSLACSK